MRILIDATEARSYFKRSFNSAGAITTTSAFVRLGLLILEEIPKLNLIIDPIIRDASGDEATSGFWSRTFYLFLGPMFRLGTRGTIQMEDLMKIGLEFDSMQLFTALSHHWKKENRAKRHSLVLACCAAWKGAFLAVFIPRLVQTGLMFSQPFIMQRIIAAVEGGEDSSQMRGGLVGATVVSWVGSPICTTITLQMVNRLLTRVRGGLASQMLYKNLHLEVLDAKKNAAVTLMTADFDGISEGFAHCLEIPFTFLESGLGIYFLAKFIKQASFVIIFPLFLATSVGILFGKLITPATKTWNQTIQTRVTRTSLILAQLPAMKMLGLAPKGIEYIQHLREVEIQASRKCRTIRSFSIASATLADLLTPAIIVGAALFWNLLGEKLDPKIVYPALSVVAIVQTPLTQLFRVYPLTMAMLGCFDRIQEFLCQEDHEDRRVLLESQPREVSRQWPTPAGTTVFMARTVEQDPARVIHFDNATLGPRGTDREVLKGVNLSIAPGVTTAVFGATGSGKSTLLNSILGEADIKKGIVYVDDVTIALVGQSSWLPNLSLRDCIVGFCEYDEEWFNTVITDCKLLEDIEELPGHENYIIGTGGIGLSGGQRQRVALARAAFARTEIVVLDDPFSALDHDTGTAILTSLCGTNGLFQQSNTTVVLTTYLPECLDIAEDVVFLDGNGNVSCDKGYVLSETRSQIMSLLVHRNNDRETGGEEEEAAAHPSSLANSQLGVQRVDETSHQKGDVRLFLFWMDEIGRLDMSYWFCLVALSGIAEGFPTTYLKYWIQDHADSRIHFIGYAILPLASGLVTGGGVYYFFNRLCPRAAVRLHRKLADSVLESTLGFLTATDSGSLLNRFSVDMDSLTKKVPPALHNTLYLASSCALEIGMGLSGATYMTLLVPIILVVMIFIQRYYLRTSRQLRHLELESQAPLVTSVRENSDGIIYIRGLGWQAKVLEHSLRLLNNSQKPVYLLLCAQQFLGLVTGLLAALLAVMLAVLTLFTKQGTSGNAAGFSFYATINLGPALSGLIIAWTGLEISIGSLSRIRSFLEKTPIESDEGAKELPENWPSAGAVEFQNVSARYNANDHREAPVLQNISVSIKAGQKFGLTGRTGSGKSSMLFALLGFLDYEGTILIDGVDIATAPRNQLRARIVTLSQDQVELDGTIRDNLFPFDKTWGKEAVVELDEKGREEAEWKDSIARDTLVRLRIWNQIQGQGGLDAPLTDAGYSHGEMQLLCIARAVVRRRLTGSKLLLVDEATGSLDRRRDHTVREVMKEYFQGCTIIIIAHRDESIADSNVTAHMENGRMGKPKVWS